MSKTAVYGIEYLKLSPRPLNPEKQPELIRIFDKVAAKFLVTAIVKDSMSFQRPSSR